MTNKAVHHHHSVYPGALLLFALLALPSQLAWCKEPGRGIDVKMLAKSWTHSREEGAEVFRPSGFKTFPLARFRMIYRFYNNGKCERMYLHASDAHSMRPCQWSLAKGDILQITGEHGVEGFQVLELTENILRLRKLTLLELPPHDVGEGKRGGRGGVEAMIIGT